MQSKVWHLPEYLTQESWIQEDSVPDGLCVMRCQTYLVFQALSVDQGMPAQGRAQTDLNCLVNKSNLKLNMWVSQLDFEALRGR